VNQPQVHSVRYFENTFYSQDWVEIFVPLTASDKASFLEFVMNAERRAGRVLYVSELVRIAECVSKCSSL
jgi:hypothetical protein